MDKNNNGHNPVDYAKLTKLFKQRGLTYATASKAIGRSETYLHGTRKNGWVNDVTLLTLKSQLNIDYDAIKPDEPPIIKAEQMKFTIEEDAIKCVDFDYDKLAKAIVDAIDEKYLGIDYSLLQKSITTSVANALSVVFDNKKPHLANLIKDNVCAGLKDAKVKSFY